MKASVVSMAVCFAIAAVLSGTIAIAQPAVAQAAGGGVEVGRLIGAQDTVTAIGVSADGKIAVAGSGNGVICIWDVPAGKCLRTIKAHTNSVRSMAVTPDGKRFVSGGDDGKVCCWSTEKGEMVSMVQYKTNISVVAMSDDGHIAAGATPVGELRIIDVDHDKMKGSIQFDDDMINALTLSPNGDRVALSRFVRTNEPNMAWKDSAIAIYQTVDGKVLANMEDIKFCFRLKFVNNGKQLEYIGPPAGYGLIDTGNFTVSKKIALQESVKPNYDAPADASFVVMVGGRDVDLAVPSDRQQQHRKLPGNVEQNNAVAVTPDGRFVLIGGTGAVTSTDQGFKEKHNGSIVVLDLSHAPPARRFEAKSLAVNSDGTVYTIVGPNSTNFYDVTKDENLPVILMNRTGALPVLTHDKQAYLNYDQGAVHYQSFARATGKRFKPIRLNYGRPVCMALSDDDHFFVIGRAVGDELDLKVAPTAIKENLQVVDVTKDVQLPDLASGPTPVTGLSFAADGRLAATFSALSDQPDLEQSLQIWDVAGAKQLQKIKLDGDYRLPRWSRREVVGAAKGKDLHFWNAKTGQALQPILMQDGVRDFCFSPDGTRLLVSLTGGNIQYLDADTGKVIKTQQLGEVKDADVKFLTNGTAVAVSYRYDQSVSVLPLDLPK